MREPKDPRSTWRKRARAVLQRQGRLEHCECKDSHSWHAGRLCGWKPEGPTHRGNQLDVNHINKVLSDIDPANLEALCRRCHREKDRRTAKGVAEDQSDFDYGLDYL